MYELFDSIKYIGKLWSMKVHSHELNHCETLNF